MAWQLDRMQLQREREQEQEEQLASLACFTAIQVFFNCKTPQAGGG